MNLTSELRNRQNNSNIEIFHKYSHQKKRKRKKARALFIASKKKKNNNNNYNNLLSFGYWKRWNLTW